MSTSPLSNTDHVLLHWLLFRCFGERHEMIEDEPRRKRMWVRPIISQRPRQGQFVRLYGDLRQHPAKFYNYCRMGIATFDRLLAELRPGLTFQHCGVSPEERLIITLRFLATGNSFSSLHFEFRMGTSMIAGIVNATCRTIWLRLRAAMLPQPSTQQWLDIAQDFLEMAQFPNCLGALDAKRIRVKKPPNSGSRFYNYKQFFSVVLLALADTNYRFIIVDIGAYGSSADARIFRASRMSRWLQSHQLDIPQPANLPGSSGPPVPYVMVGDKGFSLSPNLMRPFPRRGLDEKRWTFNYRLSRARRYVECAFGILSSKWRVLLSAIQLTPKNVNGVIKACVVLHNYIRTYESTPDEEADTFQAPAQGDSSQLGRAGSAGFRVRELFSDYFMSPTGFVPFQQQ